ncbi:M48 family metalloprotease [Maritalea mediterranea]|uniref:M48 family metalloprotease n=1 Tax=Maritalea mediterranea TaxID=2909667 RepID=A0ABS9EEK5_9HYPH|nr:M48 family metalloprotease [Maritalea mediterranea]MCF4099843.1 M48 family metalloprotease [Maritalea mediterranea]
MRSRLFPALFALALALVPLQAWAQQIRLITDAETQNMIEDFARPLLKAAGVNPRNVTVNIVNDRRFNAFVIESGDIFINYGTILDSATPNELKAVLAHEIGHLAGGHLRRLREQAEVAGRMQAISMMLGIGVLAAASGEDRSGELGKMVSAFIMGSSAAAQNNFMAYRQSEESAADAAALTYLERTGQSATGLLEVLNRLQRNQSSRAAASGYLRTHPLAEDRLNQTQNRAVGSPFRNKRDSAAEVQRLDMVKAKLTGYLERVQTVMNRYPNSDKSLPARYARAIAGYRAGAGPAAVKQMAQLAASNPRNPNLQELLGQMLFETGQPVAALKPLAKAVQLAPDEIEYRLIYGAALSDTGRAQDLNEAIIQLSRATNMNSQSARAYSLLSRAYGRAGRTGEADLAAAEAAFLRRDISLARGLAKKAKQNLPEGSPAWLRADDILALS